MHQYNLPDLSVFPDKEYKVDEKNFSCNLVYVYNNMILDFNKYMSVFMQASKKLIVDRSTELYMIEQKKQINDDKKKFCINFALMVFELRSKIYEGASIELIPEYLGTKVQTVLKKTNFQIYFDVTNIVNSLIYYAGIQRS